MAGNESFVGEVSSDGERGGGVAFGLQFLEAKDYKDAPESAMFEKGAVLQEKRQGVSILSAGRRDGMCEGGESFISSASIQWDDEAYAGGFSGKRRTVVGRYSESQADS